MNICEKKRSERQRRKGKIYLFECRVPENIRRVEKQSTKAGRFLGFGVDAQEIPGVTPEA